MKDKKGYGLIIPEDLSPESWISLTPQQILTELKDYNYEAFYRMAEDAGIDVDLLEKSGYEYNGLSELALIELEALVGIDIAQKIRNLIIKIDFNQERDFKYVLYLYLDGNEAAKEYYSEDVLTQVLEYQKYAHHEERESLLNLTALFIDEFKDDKTEARKDVLKKYDGRFIDLPELTSFLGKRSDVVWYRGDMLDSQYEHSLKKSEALLELVSLYKLISDGDEFQIKSAKIQHHKMTIKGMAVEILQDAIAYALKLHHDTDSIFSLDVNLEEDDENEGIDTINEPKIDTDMSKFVKLAEMEDAKRYLKKISKNIESDIKGYLGEKDLRLFYYLADNAIKWPKGIIQTDRYIFLYKLASNFGYVTLSELDDLENAYIRKEITARIKNQIKYYEKEDPDKEILKLYFS